MYPCIRVSVYPCIRVSVYEESTSANSVIGKWLEGVCGGKGLGQEWRGYGGMGGVWGYGGIGVMSEEGVNVTIHKV